MATVSPTYITRSCASAGRCGITSLLPPRPISGGWRVTLPTPAASTSAPVTIASTPLHLARCFDIDAADAGMRMRRAHEGGGGLIGFRRIGDETAGAAHEIVVLDARLDGDVVGLVVHANIRWDVGFRGLRL